MHRDHQCLPAFGCSPPLGTTPMGTGLGLGESGPRGIYSPEHLGGLYMVFLFSQFVTVHF
jgi:hypothetical protein